MNNNIHPKLKWSTIIQRINKDLGYEKFKIELDEIYVLKLDKFGRSSWLHYCNTLFDKELFIFEETGGLFDS